MLIGSDFFCCTVCISLALLPAANKGWSSSAKSSDSSGTAQKRRRTRDLVLCLSHSNQIHLRWNQWGLHCEVPSKRSGPCTAHGNEGSALKVCSWHPPARADTQRGAPLICRAHLKLSTQIFEVTAKMST